MKTILLHKMCAGLGEIFHSWYTLINIARVQKQRGHRIELIIDYSHQLDRYFPSGTLDLFFDLHKLQREYFDEITISETPVTIPNPTMNWGENWMLKTEDDKGLSEFYLLSAEALIREGKRTAEFPEIVTDFVKNYVDNIIKVYNLQINQAHHVRIIDGYEREHEVSKIVDLILPNLEDNDIVLSNSSIVKKAVKERSDKRLLSVDNPIEGILSNHFTKHPSGVPKDLLFTKTLYTYLDMILLTKGKHFHKYTVYDDNFWSSFLFHTALVQPNFTEHQIPKDLIKGNWNNGHLADNQFLGGLDRELRGRFSLSTKSPRANLLI